MSHFAIIDVGRAGFEIVPITPEGSAYMAKCRGTMTYSKRNIAKSAVKRMEATLSKRIKIK
ncbi:hypothetical protein [Sporomusa acidovorans]|uniref:Uncharacterized protein n=1 Tax=Sporomusa acidovorans (strain ATCC 49682 / DSM 3132 / Mol) TaxID=1123286 RepID=A0ABZ3J3U7_SPOA4|nr:hypothetical protein [Sporomusa acidovorans]OZC20278.1 hypothetical protein SPACI_26760 [Sporomusa acidovorans DSM 3132]SDD39500.1 hypothetical protein SAMN04488499_1001107 [Sporomusa acidovorans]